jgi:hypothetical protein
MVLQDQLHRLCTQRHDFLRGRVVFERSQSVSQWAAELNGRLHEVAIQHQEQCVDLRLSWKAQLVTCHMHITTLEGIQGMQCKHLPN